MNNSDNNNNINLNNINKLYDNLSYYDQYGSSIILVIILTIILILSCTYSYIMINTQPIIDDWNNQRCKPYIIPFAGFINKPKNMTSNDFTKQNFDYCTQNILKNITGNAVQPLTYATKSLYLLFNFMQQSLNSIRQMFSKVRSLFDSITKEIMGRIANIIVPLQQIVISFRDIMSKVMGIMTTGLFTLLSTYYSLKALLGAIAQMIVTILIAMVAMIALFWLFPFTWGAAISYTAIFVAISIPLAIMLAFMIDVLKVQPGLSIPTLKVRSVKCFDKNTKLKMNNGEERNIIDLNVGDILSNGNTITAKIKVEKDGSTMYNLRNIIVSDSHLVKYKDKWIRVCQHPEAKIIEDYNEKYLYCLNTSSKTINIFGKNNDNNVCIHDHNSYNNSEEIIFSDWDEVLEDDLISLQITHKCFNPLSATSNIERFKTEFIHKFYDGGLYKDTEIKLLDGSIKKISDIEVGDILYNMEKVYGIVEINGNDLVSQYSYDLGNFNNSDNSEQNNIIGSSNINFCDTKLKFTSTLNYKNKTLLRENNKKNKLYHLLTDKKTFYVGKYRLFDYNASIDLLLEKNKGKLLSMKYV